ncbi:ELMO/CED-12 family-domain-containing protein [Gaertneriomyces semiglobifer]|nr:ELMO/CED-12 family-domain-containing protein [Gaertneriomyces semiglobifer]
MPSTLSRTVSSATTPTLSTTSTHHRPNASRTRTRTLTVSISYKTQKVDNYPLVTNAKLNDVVRDLCVNHFGVRFREGDFCLRVVETEELLTEEKLRRRLTDHTPLHLCQSPPLLARHLLNSLSSYDANTLKRTLFLLQKYLKEEEFTDEFLSRGGLASLQDLIITGQGNMLAYGLGCVHALVEGREVEFNDAFISTLVSIIVKQNLVNICRPATAIIIHLVLPTSSPSTSTPQNRYGFDIVNRAISSQTSFLPTLVHRLSGTDYLLQLNSMHLINSLFRHVTDHARREFIDMLDALDIRGVVVRLLQSSPAEELKTQIVEFQRLMVLEGHQRRRIVVNPINIEHRRLLSNLWELAKFPDDVALDWTLLGFTETASTYPVRDLSRAGFLGLQLMHGYAVRHNDAYTTLFRTQAAKPPAARCPFARACIEVCNILCDYWGISTGYSTASSYSPLLLLYPQVFAITLRLFFNLWDELQGADGEDVARVASLIRSQFKHCVGVVEKSTAGGLEVLDAFEKEMIEVPLEVIRERQLKELESEDDGMNKLPIRNLRERHYRLAYATIRDQLLETLMKGAWFPIPREKGRSKNTMRFYRLGSNHKSLHYGDFPRMEDRRPGVEELAEKVDLSLITSLLPYHRSSTLQSLKPSKLPSTFAFVPSHCFSLSSLDTPIADFICSTKEAWREWTDGFSMLLDKGVSQETAAMVQTLTDVRVKVALLDITGENIDLNTTNVAMNVDGTATLSGNDLAFYYDTGTNPILSLIEIGNGTGSDGRSELTSFEEERYSEAGTSVFGTDLDEINEVGESVDDDDDDDVDGFFDYVEEVVGIGS